MLNLNIASELHVSLLRQIFVLLRDSPENFQLFAVNIDDKEGVVGAGVLSFNFVHPAKTTIKNKQDAINPFTIKFKLNFRMQYMEME